MYFTNSGTWHHSQRPPPPRKLQIEILFLCTVSDFIVSQQHHAIVVDSGDVHPGEEGYGRCLS